MNFHRSNIRHLVLAMGTKPTEDNRVSWLAQAPEKGFMPRMVVQIHV